MKKSEPSNVSHIWMQKILKKWQVCPRVKLLGGGNEVGGIMESSKNWEVRCEEGMFSGFVHLAERYDGIVGIW